MGIVELRPEEIAVVLYKNGQIGADSDEVAIPRGKAVKEAVLVYEDGERVSLKTGAREPALKNVWRLELGRSPTERKVIFDGHDISAMVKAVHVSADIYDLTHLVVEYVPEAIEVVGEPDAIEWVVAHVRTQDAQEAQDGVPWDEPSDYDEDDEESLVGVLGVA